MRNILKNLFHILQLLVTRYILRSKLLEHLQRCSLWWSAKKNSQPSLVFYFLTTPPIKLKLWQKIGWGVPIGNRLDQSLQWVNQKHWAVVRSYLLYPFLHVHTIAVPFSSHCNVCNYADLKSLSWAKPTYFHFSSSNFTVLDHILSTAGVALRDICKIDRIHKYLISFLGWS